jgi:hypothetical protein
MLHGLLGLDPRPARATPAGPCGQGELQAKPICLGHGMLEQLLPGLAHELNRPAGNADVDLQEDHTADTGSLHCLEVRRDALAGEIAIHDIPINPWPRRFWGRKKVSFEIRGRHPIRKGAKPQHQYQPDLSFHRLHNFQNMFVNSPDNHGLSLPRRGGPEQFLAASRIASPPAHVPASF